MRLKIKELNYRTEGPLICVLNKKDALNLDIHASDRVVIKGNKKEAIAVADINEGDIIKEGHIGIFYEVGKYLGLEKGHVEVQLAKKLESLWFIRNKLEGKKLSKEEINEIVKDIVENRLNEGEMTYFVAGCFSHGMNMEETYNLTKAIVENGSKLELRKKIILDKHCSGGVPGNRTTMIIVPIIAAAGFCIPKTSSRAITSAAGTADTMEVLANVSFPIKKIKKIVKKTNCCIIWGGGVDLAAADDRLIKVRRPLSLDPEGLLLASIMAKKNAVGATHVLIDLPIGTGSKFETPGKIKTLKEKFIKLGKMLGMKVLVILTDGRQPIGNGIGPSLEAIDALNILQNKGPNDLKEKSIYMAGLLLKMAGVKNGMKKARDILESGLAYEKMKEIIKAQEGNIFRAEQVIIGKFHKDVISSKSGIVKEINNKKISKIARIAGAPIDKGAGLYLYVHLKNNVKKGDKLFTVYSNSRKRLDYACKLVEDDGPAITI